MAVGESVLGLIEAKNGSEEGKAVAMAIVPDLVERTEELNASAVLVQTLEGLATNVVELTTLAMEGTSHEETGNILQLASHVIGGVEKVNDKITSALQLLDEAAGLVREFVVAMDGATDNLNILIARIGGGS